MPTIGKPKPRFLKFVTKPANVGNVELSKAEPVYIDGLPSGGGGGEPDPEKWVQYDGTGTLGYLSSDEPEPGTSGIRLSRSTTLEGVTTSAQVETQGGVGFSDVTLSGGWFNDDFTESVSSGIYVGAYEVDESGEIKLSAQVTHFGTTAIDWVEDTIFTGYTLKSAPGYDENKTQTLKHINGTITWVDDE